MNNKRTSMIFTRHQLTEEQAESILLPAVTLQELAGVTLETDAEALDTMNQMLRAADAETVDVYGVFPPILRQAFFNYDWNGGNVLVRLHEAHSVRRAAEGERPTFEFREWKHTATYLISL